VSAAEWTIPAIVASAASMAAFAVVSRRRPPDPEVLGRPKTLLLGFWVRDWLMWVLSPVEWALVKTRVPPLALNLVGVVCGLAAGIAYARGALSAAGWLVVAGGLTDVLDGRIARARDLVTPRGAFLDSTLDRFAETFAYTGLAFYFRGAPWAACATLGALAGSLLVSYARARGEADGASCRGGVMQRAERLVLLALASLLDRVAVRAGWAPGALLALALALIAAGSIGTAVYRTAAIAGALASRGVDGGTAKE
jgi:phosphatidylglycerophosphate synthase